MSSPTIHPITRPVVAYRTIWNLEGNRNPGFDGMQSDDIAEEDKETIAKIIHFGPIQDASVFHTPKMPYGSLGPAQIVDIAVVSNREFRTEAEGIFREELAKSEQLRSVLKRIVEDEVLPGLAELVRSGTICGAAGRGSMYLKGRYPTKFCDIDLLVFYEHHDKDAVLSALKECVPGRASDYTPSIFIRDETGRITRIKAEDKVLTEGRSPKVSFGPICLPDWKQLLGQISGKKWDKSSPTYIAYHAYVLRGCCPLPGCGEEYVLRLKRKYSNR